jgi:hypothetical protein
MTAAAARTHHIFVQDRDDGFLVCEHERHMQHLGEGDAAAAAARAQLEPARTRLHTQP